MVTYPKWPEIFFKTPAGSFNTWSFQNLNTALRVLMMMSIQLNDELAFMTIEIRDVVSDWMLSSEFFAFQLPVAQKSPKYFFGFGRLASQILCIIKG